MRKKCTERHLDTQIAEIEAELDKVASIDDRTSQWMEEQANGLRYPQSVPELHRWGAERGWEQDRQHDECVNASAAKNDAIVQLADLLRDMARSFKRKSESRHCSAASYDRRPRHHHDVTCTQLRLDKSDNRTSSQRHTNTAPDRLFHRKFELTCDQSPKHMLTASIIRSLDERHIQYFGVCRQHERRASAHRPRRTSPSRPRNKRKEEVFMIDVEKKICSYCEEPNHIITQCGKLKETTTYTCWQWAKENSTCLKCLIKRKRRTGYRAQECGIDGCKLRHHHLLHESRKPTPQSTDDALPPSTEDNTGEQYALLKEGAYITLVDADVAKRVGATSPKKPLRISGANMTGGDDTNRTIKISVVGTNGRAYDVKTRTMKRLQLPKWQTMPDRAIENLDMENLASALAYTDAVPEILIGSDHWPLIVPREVNSKR
ncbi:hypothetical protein EVAR_11518_1 [Eumeta japonica]|uniref:Uncharacterized protein n=1 Tax=Eumeta variegata TaxID=151549 RepID=A0A4C1U016_EUMVA|nr:hypothetical protein EVAR_11518_1 [Eumeta japonica]